MKKEIKPYAFIDRQGNKITRKDYMGQMAKKVGTKEVGEAYGFFYYGGKKSISKVLPQIKEATKTPPELTLDLVEGVDNLDKGNDSALVEIVQRAKRQHTSHVLKATLPGEGNRRAAGFLGNIMNGIYTELYGRSEPFCAEIVYKRGEKYVFRRE